MLISQQYLLTLNDKNTSGINKNTKKGIKRFNFRQSRFKIGKSSANLTH